MTCPIDSPWGEITFEALTGHDGYRVQLTQGGQILGSDWVANSSELMSRWQKVRDGLAAAAALSAQPSETAVPPSIVTALGR
jgi:hypothetical protein